MGMGDEVATMKIQDSCWKDEIYYRTDLKAAKNAQERD